MLRILRLLEKCHEKRRAVLCACQHFSDRPNGLPEPIGDAPETGGPGSGLEVASLDLRLTELAQISTNPWWRNLYFQ